MSVFINPILRKLDNLAQARAISLFAGRLGAAMPFWYVTSLLLLIAENIVRRHEYGHLLLITAIAIWIAVIIHTLVVLVPINNRMTQLGSEALTSEAQREHKKWDSLHRMRVAALGTSMVCFLVAIRL